MESKIRSIFPDPGCGLRPLRAKCTMHQITPKKRSKDHVLTEMIEILKLTLTWSSKAKHTNTRKHSSHLLLRKLFAIRYPRNKINIGPKRLVEATYFSGMKLLTHPTYQKIGKRDK